MITADIIEVFSSIQGEGIFLGARQIFARFKSCNMSCSFCDEDLERKAVRYTPLELMSVIKKLDAVNGPHHSVSLTGGEPLLSAEFIKVFLRILWKNRSFKSYLETNGTLPYELAKIIDLVDIIAMDLKLPSSTGERPFWSEHAEFLKIASGKKVFVKAVVTGNTKKEDIEKAIALVKGVKKNIPFVLQPVTPVGSHEKQVDKESLLAFIEIGLKKDISNIRVIPQMHKMLNIK